MKGEVEMRNCSRANRVVCLMLIATISLVGLPVIAAPTSAHIGGTIFSSGDGVPVEGAVVKAASLTDSKIYESAVTNDKGNYSLSGLPAGKYDVAVQSGGGLYVVSGVVALEPGEKRTLSLAVRPAGHKQEAAEEPPPAEPPPANPPAPENPPSIPADSAVPAEPTKEGTPTEAAQPQKKSFFRTAWGGAIIVVGTAIVVGALASSSNDDEPANASPSN
jgi:hypothetical protein